MIPVEASFVEWRKNPEYVEAYDALEDEFSRATATIEAKVDTENRTLGARPCHGLLQAPRDRFCRLREGREPDLY